MIDELTPAEKSELKRQVRIELAKRYAKTKNILGWGKMLFPEKFSLPFCRELHDYFVHIRGMELTNTEAPRNHSKTTIKCFLIPLFQALEEANTFNHYLNVQATNIKALSVNTAIRRELEENQELKAIYGDQVGVSRWTDQQFVLRNGTIFTAVSAGQSIRGLNFRNTRPDYIVVDDLYDEEDINNPDATTKKNDWFWGSLYPARAKSRRCAVHVQGTAINGEDLLEELKGKERWVSATFKAIKDWDSSLVLWPELNTMESLNADRIDMGSVIFFREMQNERRDETSSIVKRSWLENWEYDPTQIKFDLHHTLTAVILGVDPSIGEKSENDFTGIALVHKAQYADGNGNVYYINRLWNEHLSLDARVRLLQSIYEDQPTEHGITQANIESIAGFKDFCAEVVRRTNIPVHEIDNVKDKITTLENKSHYFENGKVKINKNIDPALKDMLMYQLTTNHPKHDDLRDGVLLCLDDKSGLWNHV